jgi:MATE family multidrug resistance protein
VLFTAFSATLGTEVLAENVLLLQIVALSMYMCDGVQYATVAFIGNFQGQKARDKFVPLLQIALATNLVIALVVGLVTIFFPTPIFYIFTNHSELIEAIKVYIPWVILVIVSSGFAYIIDGYFAGLGEGTAIRNTYLISGSIGFISLTLSTFYFHSNHFLWLSLSMFMLSCALILGIQIPITFQLNQEQNTREIKNPNEIQTIG